VSDLCRTLGVTRSGYYAWLNRPASARAGRRKELVKKIREAHAAGRELYGSPRVHAELKASGVAVCENTVAKYMREEAIEARTHRRFRVRTTDADHDHPVADNVLARDFAADAPDAKWATDITYVPTDEGWLYLAAVIDLCSRRIVGWAMADHMRAELCLDALDMAVLHRRPDAGLLHHSDRGVQYCCDAYRARVDALSFVASMSRTGDCYDNAAMESFWGTFKRELVYQQPDGRFATREQAKRMIFEYVEVFYNRQRRHSAMGYKSPEQFEASRN
jgi:putative transposase